MIKPKLLVSVSGGETSMFMAIWINNNWADKYELLFVFSNTGDEREETLEFIQKCQEYYGLKIVWIEAVVQKGMGNGIRHKVVEFNSASRKGEPFEAMVQKYGLPNISTPHCSKFLKSQVIKNYAKKIGWKGYETAIGIRSDEFDRVSKSRIKDKIIYPLITENETSKPMVNVFWRSQPFRLNLKGYEDNCKACWKKSDRKLATIARDTPEAFDFFKRVESKYGEFVPDSRKHNPNIKLPIRLFRGNKTVEDIFELAQDPTFEPAEDDRTEYRFQLSINNQEWDVSNGCEESCEAF